MVRPTFKYNGNPVRAAGIIFWTEIKGVRWNLLRHYKGKWQDTGGKTDEKDVSFLETAVREACEETNGQLFPPGRIHDMLKNPRLTKIQYNAKCKYVLFTCYVEPPVKGLPLARFGETEGGKPHKFQWFQKKPVLHFRLRRFII